MSGRIYGLDGKALSAGKRVDLIVWPRNEELGKVKVGDGVPTQVLSTTVTDSAGNYVLVYPGADRLREFASTVNGALNLSVQSFAGGVSYDFSLSRSAGPVDGVAAAEASTRQLVELRPRPGTPVLPKHIQRSLNASPIPAGPVPCGLVRLADVVPRWVQVGRAFSTTKTSAAMTSTSGASSTLGVGISTDQGASFSASGSTSVGSTATVGMSKLVGYHTPAWRSQFVYSKYGYTCAGPGYYTKLIVKATSFAGGASNKNLTRPKATNCVSAAKGSSFIKDDSRSSSYSAGASVSGDIGINLSAQTGFSYSTSIRFNFAAKRRLCGTAGFPGASPGVLRAKE